MHLVHDLVHELAVMRDEQQGAGIVLQVVLQPEERKQVEVVRRLIEQQKVRLHDEQPGKAGPHDPATAHLPRLPVEIRVAIPQPAQHLLRLRLHLRIVQRIVLGVRLHVFRGGHSPRRLQLVQPLFQLRQFVHPAGGHIQDRFIAMGFALLREIADHGPFIPLDRAGVRHLLFEDDGKKRCLAGAVRPDQGDPVAVIHLKRGVLEEHPPAQGHLKISNCEHGTRVVADCQPALPARREGLFHSAGAGALF